MDELSLERARNFLKQADDLLDSNSAIDKFEKHQGIVSQWNAWSCQERLDIGRLFEKRHTYVKSIMDEYPGFGNPTQSTFNYHEGEIPAFIFDRPNDKNAGIIKITDPFKDCKIQKK